MAEWSFVLLDCASDPQTCCYGYFCGLCMADKNWKKVRGTSSPCCAICFCPASVFWTRQFIRSRKHMERAYLSDCCVTYCCWGPANCQNSRELKEGFGLAPHGEYFKGQEPPQISDNDQMIYGIQAQNYIPQPPQYGGQGISMQQQQGFSIPLPSSYVQ